MSKALTKRNDTVTTESGKDVTSTEQISGQAKKSAAESARNETVQYTTGSTDKGMLGGKPSND